MSAAKHTPGPWKTGPKPYGHCRIYSDAETHAIARTYGPDLNGIGVCDLTGPMNWADAHLIAATPELLEALKNYVHTIASAGGGDRDLFMAAIREADNIARATIAKAEAA